MFRKTALISGIFLMGLLPASAGPEAFKPGDVIKGYGAYAPLVDGRLSADTVFKIAYDISKPGEEGKVSRNLETPARFLNMHNAAGVPVENMHLAVVVHGGAHKDLLTDEARGSDNPNAELIADLLAHGVTIELCGQTAAYYGVSEDDLLPGVRLGLSAMTAHALLQQDGYTLNPF